MTRKTTEPRRGIVLSGGAARGAYEAGVLSYIFRELPVDVLEKGRVHVICGVSVGAIHAAYLAATAHMPRRDVGRLVDLWKSLRLSKMLRLRPLDLLMLPRDVRALFKETTRGHGVLIDARRLREVVLANTPWDNIGRNLHDGWVDALTVSATHIASGRTTVFVDTNMPELPPWSRDVRVHARRVRIGSPHALASAAIPVLFPPVNIDGAYYCDGGLRQNTPLSPALRLGCDRVLVVALRHQPEAGEPAVAPAADERVPGPFFLLGKVADALMLDRLDYDLARLQGFNMILREGQEAFGSSFLDQLSDTAERMRGATYRPVVATVVRPSRDIGEMAQEFVEVLRQELGWVGGWLLSRMAAGDVLGESDLLSYLFFDGRLGEALIELGRADADAMRDQLIEFFRD